MSNLTWIKVNEVAKKRFRELILNVVRENKHIEINDFVM